MNFAESITRKQMKTKPECPVCRTEYLCKKHIKEDMWISVLILGIMLFLGALLYLRAIQN